MDENYGFQSVEQYGGTQITPRYASVAIEGLTPDAVVHYRLVGVNEEGTTVGEDATFRTSAK